MVKPFSRGDICLSIMDSALYGVLVYKGDEILFANSRAADMLGYENQEALVGKSLADLIYPDDRVAIEERIHGSSVHQVVVGEERLIRVDGSCAFAEIEIFPVALLGGFPGNFMLLRDVSMRKKVEESHWESEKKYWQLFNSMIDGVFISSVGSSDALGKISEVNDSLCDMLDFSRDDLIGIPVIDLIDSNSRDDAEKIGERLLDSGEILCSIKLLKKDGESFPAELSARVIPLWDYPVVMTVVRDLSDSFKAVNRIRSVENRYRSIFDNLVDALSLNEILVDDGGVPWNYRILDVNPAYEKLVGIQKDNLVGRTALDVFPGDDFFLIDLFGSVALSGEPKRFEHSSVERDLVWDVVVFSPGNGQFALLVRDITDKRKLERQIHQTQKLRSLGELTGGIANDFGAYFQAISGYSNTLFESSSDPSARVIGNRLLEMSERGIELVRKLLTFSRRGEMKFAAVAVHDILVKLRGLFSYGFEGGPRLDLSLKAPFSRVWGDEGQLYNAVMNLILNAREADLDGENIVVSTECIRLDEQECKSLFGEPEPGDFLRISVEDHGTGISRGDLSRVMEPFFSTKLNGSGMGLPEVFGTARSHGGGLSLKTKEMVGTEVSLYLPLLKDDLDESQEEPEGALGGSSGLLQNSGDSSYALKRSLQGHRPKECLTALSGMAERSELADEALRMIRLAIEEYRFDDAVRILEKEDGD